LRWSWCELSRNAMHHTQRRPTRRGGARLRRQHARIGISRPPEPTAVCVARQQAAPRAQCKARRRLAQTARARRLSASTAPAKSLWPDEPARAAVNHSAAASATLRKRDVACAGHQRRLERAGASGYRFSTCRSLSARTFRQPLGS
jgi:hypothetical protein